MIPHFTIRNAMGSDFADQLLSFAIASRESAQPGRLQTSGAPRRQPTDPPGKIDTSVRNVLVIDILPDLGKALEREVDARLPEAVERLGVPALTGRLKQRSMVIYGDGAFFARHRDLPVNPPPGRPLRTVTFVYYFHREPRQFTGGALRLHGLLNHAPVDIEPERDALVVFPSWVPHEVLPVACPSGAFADGRFAVNVWVLSEVARTR